MEIAEIDVDGLVEAHSAGVTIIDVRNPDEYEEAHVPGARLIPLGVLVDRVVEVPEDEPVFVICASGGRSMKACEYLSAQGRTVTNIAGGTKGWVAAGHPTNAGDAP